MKVYAIYNGSRFERYVRAADAHGAKEYACREYGRDAYADGNYNRHGHHGLEVTPDRHGFTPRDAPLVG
jgi:hypothetical protein